MSERIRQKFNRQRELLGIVPPAEFKFGNLTVLTGRAVYREGKAKIHCRCICDRQVWKELYYLLRGSYTSCGNPYCKTRSKSSDEVCCGLIYKRYERAAKERNIEFSLTRNDFDFFILGRCHYCLAERNNRFTYKRLRLPNITFTYSGVDRIDSDSGYHLWNCVSCCDSCNMAKLKSSYDDFIQRCNRVALLHPRPTINRPGGNMNFLQKLRVATLGTAHDLLDKYVDQNSPSALRQFIRDLEDAIGKLQTESAVQHGQLRTQKREHDDLDHQIASDLLVIKSLQTSAPDKARAKAEIVVMEKKRLAQMETDIQTQQKVSDELDKAVEALQQKHAVMINRLRELERIDRDSKAKESAASALTAAGSIAGSMGSQSVDDLEDRMRRRNDVANAKFDQAMGSVEVEHPDSDEVDALIASLK
jgi:phage shock protein A